MVGSEGRCWPSLRLYDPMSLDLFMVGPMSLGEAGDILVNQEFERPKVIELLCSPKC